MFSALSSNGRIWNLCVKLFSVLFRVNLREALVLYLLTCLTRKKIYCSKALNSKKKKDFAIFERRFKDIVKDSKSVLLFFFRPRALKLLEPSRKRATLIRLSIQRFRRSHRSRTIHWNLLQSIKLKKLFSHDYILFSQRFVRFFFYFIGLDSRQKHFSTSASKFYAIEKNVTRLLCRIQTGSRSHTKPKSLLINLG